MEFEQKILQFMKQFHMMDSNTGILIGLSGGADSVALLEVLYSFRKNLNLKLAAVHVHHGIRLEAEEDAAFCRQFCLEKDVDFYLEKADIPQLAKEQGIGLEEAGRQMRYQLFEQYRQRLGLDVIAVAHHQNDQAETMLFQLFRGTGLRGLAGMRPVKNRIIRPFLAVRREEIEEYLQKKGIEYVTDATNALDEYTRNKIRHYLIPSAEEIAYGAVTRMNSTAGQLREVLDFMEQQVAVFLKANSRMSNGTLEISIEAFMKVHPALQKMIIMEAIDQTFQSRKDVTEKHIQVILELCEKDGEKKVQLPAGAEIIKSYGRLLFRPKEVVDFKEKTGPILIEPDKRYFLTDGRVLETKYFFKNNLENIPQNDCVKWVDYDKIKSKILLRTREQGDYLTIRDDGATKSLQDYLVNEKVPREERDSMYLLADGNHIIWVLGKRISAYYKVTEQTKHILQIYIGGREDG